MAERRMFAKTIVTSDAFLDMPASARCLYFLLAMVADDDGFVNAPRSVMRQTGATEDDMKLLITKRFVLTFKSGIVVIKHWCIHNTIQKDRYKETKYLEEKSQLVLDKKEGYTEAVSEVYPECIQSGYKPDTQVRLGEVKLGEASVGEVIEDVPDINVGHKSPKTVRHKYGSYKNVLLTDEDFDKLREEFPSDWGDRIERLSEYMASTGKSYKNHLATIRNWAKRDKPQKQAKKGSSFLDLVEDDYE